MGRIDGVLEKRFILESCATEGTRLFLEYGGRRLSASLAGVDGEGFSLFSGPQLDSIPKTETYHLEIRFRSLVIHAMGRVLSAGDRRFRLGLGDPWNVEPAAAPRTRPVLPSIALSLDGKRIDAAWPDPPEGSDPSFSRALSDSLARLAFSLGFEADLGSDPPLGSSLSSLLSSQHRRLAVFGPPAAIPEALPGTLSSSAFLSRIEYESLISGYGDGGKEEAPLPSIGLHSAVLLESRRSCSFRAKPLKASFVGVSPAEVLRFLLLEGIASFSRPAEDAVLCAALQPDGLCLWSPRDSALSSIPIGSRAGALVSYPGRTCRFESLLLARAALGDGCLSILELETGRPEDFRLLFERIFSLAMDGDFADYLIKKAAS